MQRLFSASRVLRHWLRSLAMRAYLALAFPGIRCHRSVRFGRGVTVLAFDGGTMEIGAGTFIQDHALLQVERGHLAIGGNCLIGRGSVVACKQAVSIGDGTLIAEHVTIRDHDHRTRGEGRLEAMGHDTAPVLIGHDVWLGAKVTVTRGVEIAPHAVVGANSVVTRTPAKRGVYAGAPARRIDERSRPEGLNCGQKLRALLSPRRKPDRRCGARRPGKAIAAHPADGTSTTRP